MTARNLCYEELEGEDQRDSESDNLPDRNMSEVQENLLPRSITFATVALVVFLLVFMVIGIHTYGEDPGETDGGEDGERRRRRCKTFRGCFAYFKKTSATLPLWKSVLLKFGVVLVTTMGSTCVSLVINNATANREETIKQTIAEILNFNDDFSRRRRETCTETNDSACWENRVQNMIDQPKNLCDQVNEWGETVDPVFCTLFVSMIIFVLVFMAGLLVPVVAFLIMGPVVKAVKTEEISNAVLEAIRRKIHKLTSPEAPNLATDPEDNDQMDQMPTTMTGHWMSPNPSLGAIPKRGTSVPKCSVPPTGPKPSVSPTGSKAIFSPPVHQEEFPLMQITDVYEEIDLPRAETGAVTDKPATPAEPDLGDV